MAGFGSLEIAKRALTAQRYGLDVTSNNIANVNTPGFSRRQVVMAETAPQPTNSSFLGTGVVVQRIQSYREEFHDREIRNNVHPARDFGVDHVGVQQRVVGVHHADRMAVAVPAARAHGLQARALDTLLETAVLVHST